MKEKEGITGIGSRNGKQHSLPTNVARVRFADACHMWVEFVVDSRPCSERFSVVFTQYSGFLLPSKTSISKFQFDLESVPS